MSLPRLFFFYGTLIAGSDNSAARAVHRSLNPIGLASVPGALWAVPDPAGWYPALLKGQGRVSGVVYRATAEFTPEDLADLDAWEDYRPGNRATSLYVRKEMPLSDADGASIAAQVYRFNQPLPPGAVAIPEGDFQRWLTTSGLAAYDE